MYASHSRAIHPVEEQGYLYLALSTPSLRSRGALDELDDDALVGEALAHLRAVVDAVLVDDGAYLATGGADQNGNCVTSYIVYRN